MSVLRVMLQPTQKCAYSQPICFGHIPSAYSMISLATPSATGAVLLASNADMQCEHIQGTNDVQRCVDAHVDRSIDQLHNLLEASCVVLTKHALSCLPQEGQLVA